MSMSCFDCHDYMDGYNRGKKDGTIEELENLKQEIVKHSYREFENSTVSFDDNIIKTRVCMAILENRIATLKGENNER